MYLSIRFAQWCVYHFKLEYIVVTFAQYSICHLKTLCKYATRLFDLHMDVCHFQHNYIHDTLYRHQCSICTLMCAISSQTATGFRLAALAHLCTAPGESRPRLLLFAIKSLFATLTTFLQQDLHFWTRPIFFFLQQDLHFCNKALSF